MRARLRAYACNWLQVLVLPFVAAAIALAVRLDGIGSYSYLMPAIPLLVCFGLLTLLACVVAGIGLFRRAWHDDDDGLEVFGIGCGGCVLTSGLIASVALLALRADGYDDVSWMGAVAPALPLFLALTVAGCGFAWSRLSASRRSYFTGLYSRAGHTREALAALRMRAPDNVILP